MPMTTMHLMRDRTLPGVERSQPRTAAGNRSLERPVAGDPVQRGTRRLLLGFAVLTALATYQLLEHGRDTDHYWAWTILDQRTTAFLGAAYASGFLLSVLSLRRNSWRQIRVAVATVTVFTMLTLVATLVHAHRLHLHADDPLARSAAWFWLAVYAAVPLACLTVLGRQEGSRQSSDVIRTPMSGWLRWLLAGQGAALLTVGVVLFVGGLTFHEGVKQMGVWPWPLPALAAGVVGAWLIAFGVGAVLVIRERDLSRLSVPAVAYTAFAVLELAVLLGHRAQLDGGSPLFWAFVALLSSMALAGGYGWRASRRDGAAPACSRSPLP